MTKSTTTYSVLRLGTKFSGPCVCCQRETGSRPHELADTVLLRKPDGKFAVAHPRCAGITTKGAISGGRKMSGPSEITA